MSGKPGTDGDPDLAREKARMLAELSASCHAYVRALAFLRDNYRGSQLDPVARYVAWLWHAHPQRMTARLRVATYLARVGVWQTDVLHLLDALDRPSPDPAGWDWDLAELDAEALAVTR
jgi:hypothetical protein